MNRLLVLALSLMLGWNPAYAAQLEKWVTSWTASAQGPYPAGFPGNQQPEMKQVFPNPEFGARDQSFRLILRPDLWGEQARVRLSNAFGTRAVTFDGVHIGVQMNAAAVVPGTNRAVRFGGRTQVTVPAGQSVWSDAVALPFVREATPAALAGRKLAVSLHVVGESGPMTWHAKALTTSYVSLPGSGARSAQDGEAGFPAATASWFFVDALDMTAQADARLVVCFGDSITDGSSSTMNGDDRWPDVLSRRLHAAYGSRVSVVNAGIGGNQVAGPAEYSPQKPFPGGPAPSQRFERDLLSLSGVGAVIWLEGINDFGKAGNASAQTVQAVMREQVARLRAALPGVRVIGATVVSALGSSNANHGFPEQDEKRRALNEFIRHSGVFDGVADFDQATLDPATGSLRPEYIPDSNGGPGDRLHPNRQGYLAMGQAIDLSLLMPDPLH